MSNGSILSDTDRIRYEETDLSFLAENPYHFRCGIYIACVSGGCEVSTGAESFRLCPQTELIFLNGTLLHRLEATDDFMVRMILFPKDVFLKAILPIDTPYMNYANEHPCYVHTPDARSQTTWMQLCVWMDMARMLFCGDYRTQFRDMQEYSFLQGLLLWLFNTVPEKLEIHSRFSRQQLLCQKFLQLIREYGATEHSSSFYAEKLCVSPRYLHRATTQCLEGRSPKQLIEEQLHRLSSEPLTARRLSMAKRQFIAQLAISSENNESYMLGAGKSLLVHDEMDTMAQVYAKIRALTAEQLLAAARETFADLSQLTWGGE